MPDRLEIPKTYKLFIGGQFPRSESGRSLPITGPRGTVIAHFSRASRKDLRNAVEAARAALPKWAGATACNRGQILYRMAEMLEGKKREVVEMLEGARRHEGAKGRGKASNLKGAAVEVETAIDRLVCFGGWADKYAQVLGCNNPVAGPYYNFTVPEPTGIVGIIAPDHPALLGMISLLAPPLCAGNTVVALASETHALTAALLGEVCATSDVPAGAVNLLTGLRSELIPHFASHREINAIHAAGISLEHARILREGAADNLKRITVRNVIEEKQESKASKQRSLSPWFDDTCHSPWWIEPFVEFKTVWHPSGA
jgi:acyl-CoA reductase-like NAD-dependent aldehyde dehydrogenase